MGPVHRADGKNRSTVARDGGCVASDTSHTRSAEPKTIGTTGSAPHTVTPPVPRSSMPPSAGKIAIKNARYASQEEALDPDCRCYTCSNFSRAYLRHLFVAREMTSSTLNTIHNLHFYLELMRRIRRAIEEDRFDALLAEGRERLPDTAA